MNALCKYRGMLVIIEVTQGGATSACPDCGATELRDAPHGWMECAGECGFAILKNHWLYATGQSIDTEDEL